MDAIEEVLIWSMEKIRLGRPPKDLSLVLAKMAIAGPGTTCLRALSRMTGGLNMPLEDIWISACEMSLLSYVFSICQHPMPYCEGFIHRI